MASNSSCSVVIDHVGIDNSAAQRIASLIYGVLMCVLVIATLAVWFFRRKHPYLRSRNLQVVALSSIGFVMEIFANAFARAFPNELPCEIVVFCFYNAGIFLVWPATARLWLKHMRIKYYQSVAKSSLSGRDGVEDPVAPAHIEHLKWRTTRKYARLLVAGPLVLNTIFALTIPFVYGCSCDTPGTVSFFEQHTVLALVYFLGLLVVIISSKVYVARQINSVPDPLGVNVETLMASLSASSIIIFGFAFVASDLGGFRLMVDAPWNWAWLIDFAFMFHFFFLGPLPLLLSFRKKIEVNAAPRDKLQKLLEDDRGVDSLSNFLATELSLENLLFLVRLRKWQEELPEQDQPTRRQSMEDIYEGFVKLNAEFELNISNKVREKVEKALNSNEVEEKEVFEPAVKEVEYLIRYHSWPRFVRSVFYKLYIGLSDEQAQIL